MKRPPHRSPGVRAELPKCATGIRGLDGAEALERARAEPPAGRRPTPGRRPRAADADPAYENAVVQNRELVATQQALEDFNRHLEQRVNEQTGALQESARRFQSLTENMMDLICVVDAAGKLSYVSPSIEVLGGYAPDEALGRPFLDFVHPDDAAVARADLMEIIRKLQGAPRGELRFRHKNGSYVALESVTKNALRDPAVRGLVVNARDVTARRRAEDERRAQLARVRAQFEAVGLLANAEALLAGDFETLVRQLDEVAARVTGAERANVWLFNEDETELRCIDLFEATPGKHSSGMVLKESEFRNEFQAFQSASHVAADDALTDRRTAGYAEGYLKPLRITSMLDTVIAVAGEHKGLLCIEHVDKPHHWEPDEIAFASQLADKLRLCLANRHRSGLTRELEEAQRVAHVGNWRLDPATGKIIWSEEIYRILGRDATESAPEFRKFPGFMTSAAFGQLEAAVAECQRSGTPFDLDLDVLHASGEHRWVKTRGEAIRDAAGTVVTLRGTAADVTELKITAQALAERAKEQRCLHLVAALGARPDLTEEGLLREVPALLVPAFQYPEITCARIVHKDREFASPDFTLSPWILASELKADGVSEGRIEVCYRQERPPAADGPFLAEERALLDAVAGTLGSAMAARRLTQALRAQLDELRRWQNLGLDREDRILELKREVNRALAQVGQRARYENA